MDAYLCGTGMNITTGAIKACNDTLRSRREEEDEYYKRYSTPWAPPAWITALPGLLRGVNAWVAAHRQFARNIQHWEV